MGTHGPMSGATFSDDSLLGTIGLSNPNNAAVSDGVFVTAVLLLGQVSHYLKATAFNFNIPLDATITGITAEIERAGTVLSAIADSSVRLVKGGTIAGSDKASASLWPTSKAYASYGSASDLWGATWTPADINDPGFGVMVNSSAAIAATAQIDHVRVTVDYVGSNRASVGEGKRLRCGDGMLVSAVVT